MASSKQNTTKPNSQSVATFIKSIDHETRRRDAKTLHKLMGRISGKRAKMWGPSMVGYGKYHYKYESGREGDMFITGFSPRKQAMSIYIMPGFKAYSALLKKLGQHKIGKSCLYVKSLDDIDIVVLEELITRSVEYMTKKYL